MPRLFRCISCVYLCCAVATTVMADEAPASAQSGGLSSNLAALYSMPMIPLWICSIMLLIERFRALRAGAIVDPAMADKVVQCVGDNRVGDAKQAAVAYNTVVGRAWDKGLTEFQLGDISIEEALTDSTALAFKPLRRNLSGIATISVVSPLLGLLGTVIGMVMVFDEISLSVNPDKQEMARGIMLALYTTVFGLIIAIPGIVGGRYLSNRVNRFAEQVEADIDRVRYAFVHARNRKREAGESPPAADTKPQTVQAGADP